MIRLLLLEWREMASDLRSWIIALLPLFFFSISRTIALAGGAPPLSGGLELFHYGLPALMLQMTLLADLLAHQRVRGELELLWLLPLSPARLLATKLLAVALPTLLLLGLQLCGALAILSKYGVVPPTEEILWPVITLIALVSAFATWGARLALSGGTVRSSVARLFALLFLLIVAVEVAALTFGAWQWCVPLLLSVIAVVNFRALLRNWNNPATWLGD